MAAILGHGVFAGANNAHTTLTTQSYPLTTLIGGTTYRWELPANDVDKLCVFPPQDNTCILLIFTNGECPLAPACCASRCISTSISASALSPGSGTAGASRRTPSSSSSSFSLPRFNPGVPPAGPYRCHKQPSIVGCNVKATVLLLMNSAKPRNKKCYANGSSHAPPRNYRTPEFS